MLSKIVQLRGELPAKLLTLPKIYTPANTVYITFPKSPFLLTVRTFDFIRCSKTGVNFIEKPEKIFTAE